MKFIEFQEKFKDRVLIDLREVAGVFADFDHRRIYEWQKRGYIKKLINNFYVFAKKDFTQAEVSFIANKLVEPSYISLESALRYYNLIPETVYLNTCITTRKTRMIKSAVGNFQYRSLKKELFFGYKLVNQDALVYRIAEPEKAVLDFLYLRADIKSLDALKELRLNQDEWGRQIDKKKIEAYARVFESRALFDKLKKFNRIMI